ncbi:thioredoxin family protein [Chitinophaga niabensis]|uniref:Thioredoxin n=1 Tax=Chitinophaga niabensis TaxID=536979 RepID=A0A1N6F7P5_9BACT|nr:thioredoxin domain-containing protein [Chitinophaga niabensis]SIN91259.1 Thioredoxin [Chitinophaga niabensis]
MRYILIILLAFTSLSAQSQISFKDSSWTWTAMLAEAKKNDQLIFVDAYAVWCGPCKWMTKNVFGVKEVASLYNRNFVNAYIDMEKGEGITLRQKYNVRAYPTYLFINGDGEVVHRVVGSTDTAKFIQHGLDALSPVRNLQYLQRNYAANQKDYNYVLSYLKALSAAYETKEAGNIALEYLNAQGPAAWIEKSNWTVLKDFTTDASSAPFLYLVNNAGDFSKRYDAKEVEPKIYQTFLAWPQQYISYPDKGKAVLDEKGYRDFQQKLKASKYPAKEEVLAKADLTIYFATKEWRKYAKVVNHMLATKLIPMTIVGGDWLYSYGQNVNRFVEDQEVVAEATSWAKLISTNIPDLKPQQKVLYLDLYASLLEKKGDKALAANVRKDLDKEKVEAAKRSTGFMPMKLISN